MFAHYVARLTTRCSDILHGDSPRWLWPRLARCFPFALGAVLMPDHLHVIAFTEDPERARADLARLLGWHGRLFAGGPAWQSPPPPQPIADLQKLRRQLRYVALNPCRAGLADDPLAWLWSTHREVFGAVVEPWVRATDLAAHLLDDRPRFSDRWHRYVSADPSVDVSGSPPPRPATATDLPLLPLCDIWLAAAVALRLPPAEVSRRGPARHLFVLLATAQGWAEPRHLTRCCGASPRTIRRLRALPLPTELDAASLCLGDERLLRAIGPSNTPHPTGPSPLNDRFPAIRAG